MAKKCFMSWALCFRWFGHKVNFVVAYCGELINNNITQLFTLDLVYIRKHMTFLVFHPHSPTFLHWWQRLPFKQGTNLITLSHQGQSLWELFRVHYLAQGYFDVVYRYSRIEGFFDVQTGGDRTTDLPLIGCPALPPEPQLPFKTVQ